ncbi:MAG: PIN domain-containing protein, partial [Nanoarchaeota archaeon]
KSRDFFKDTIESGGFYFSVITEAELLSGKECEEISKMNRVLELLSLGQKLEIDNNIAKKSGELRRLFSLNLDDAFIGATTVVNNATLLTRNLGDFKKVKGLVVKCPY